MRFLIVYLAALAACSSSDSPEQQVRRVIEDMELAAEARDVGGLIEHVATEYRDANGQDRTALSRMVHGYFIANQSIHLLSRIEQLDFIADDEARAIVRVGMAGREAEADGNWDLAVDLHRFEVAFRRYGDEWKVSHADWSQD